MFSATVPAPRGLPITNTRRERPGTFASNQEPSRARDDRPIFHIPRSAIRSAVFASGMDSRRWLPTWLTIILLSIPSFAQAPQVENALLTASDAAIDEFFGRSVSCFGDTILCGSPADGNTTHGGATYVFVRRTTGWVEQARLVPSGIGILNSWGHSVSLWNETAAIGASSSDWVHVFERSGSSWSERTLLTPDPGLLGNQGFGNAVSIHANTILVGAIGDDTSGNDAGAAYVFVRSGTNWIQQAKLLRPGGSANQRFGWSVSLHGDTAVIAAPFAQGTGTVDVFERVGQEWIFRVSLVATDTAFADMFGAAVSTDGSSIVVGAPNHDGSGSSSGAAYVFVRSSQSWVQQATLVPNNGVAMQEFGYAAAIRGDKTIIGAWHFPDLDSGGGAAYVFDRVGTTWSPERELRASNTLPNDSFGESVALWADRVVIGASYNNTAACNGGAMYVFEVGSYEPCVVGDFCFGDGGDQMGCTDCPCGNNAPAGTISGCAHSQSNSLFGGRGARLLHGVGCAPIADFCFELQEAKPNSFAVLVSASSMAPTGTAPCASLNPGSGIAQPLVLDGLRCVVSSGSGSLLRHGTRAIDASGYVGPNGIGSESAWGNCSATFPNSGFSAGTTRHFQAFYRGGASGGCGTQLNSSQGVTVEFQALP